jgi:hypothetical protein
MAATGIAMPVAVIADGEMVLAMHDGVIPGMVVARVIEILSRGLVANQS